MSDNAETSSAPPLSWQERVIRAMDAQAFRDLGQFQELLNALEDIEGDLQHGSQTSRKARHTHRRLTDDELDQELLRVLVAVGFTAADMEKLFCVGEYVKMQFNRDPLLHLVGDQGLLRYIDRARSSLPRWALNLPSAAVSAAVGGLPGLQNFHVLVAVLLMQEKDWIDPFVSSAQSGKPVALRTFVRNRHHFGSSRFPGNSAGFYALRAPGIHKEKGYLGYTDLFKRRMKEHEKSKGVNSSVRNFVGKNRKANSLVNWTKFALVEIDESWPKEFRSILEAACIALGDFTGAEHFNINYFDAAGFQTLYSKLDILSFWLQLCVESVTTDDETGAIVRFPARGDEAGWEARFGHASGLPGCAMANLAYCYHRTNFTDLLPRPHDDAFLGEPSQVYGGLAPHQKAAAVRPEEKPEGHNPVLLTNRKITNITNHSHVRVSRRDATEEEVLKASSLPIPQQPSNIAAINKEQLSMGRNSAAAKHRALLAEKKREREAAEQSKAKRSKKAPR